MNTSYSYDIKNEFREQVEFVYKALCQSERWQTVAGAKINTFEEIWYKSALGRLMLYFLYNELVSLEERVDCDVSYAVMSTHIKENTKVLVNGNCIELLHQQCAGKELQYKFCLSLRGGFYFGDTITSIWNPIRLWITDPRVYGEYFSEGQRQLILEGDRYRISEDNCHNLRKILGRNVSNKGIWAAYILINLDHFEKLMSDNLREVLRQYHTRKNFILVPQFFNLGSAGRFACNDFGDLKLKAIQDFFKTSDKIYLEKLFNDIEIKCYVAGEWVINQKKTELRKRETLEKTLLWLNEFDDWQDFVEANKLHDYIDDKGRVKLFWDGHDYGEIPNKEQLIQLFDNLAQIFA